MTTPVPTRKLLKEYLDDLNEEKLKEFQWHLCQIEINGSRPILRSRLENATRVTTVDKLVEAFGEDGAVERTVDTFFWMNLNDPAYRLIQAKVDESLEQKEEEPETSSAGEKPREVDPNILEDLYCSTCFNLFTDPVMLQCGHSFCQTCVHEYWERNNFRGCSLCKQAMPEADPPINFILKSLCENYRGRSQAEPPGHRNHTETFQTPPENIREEQEAFELIKTQSCNTENQIMDDFKMLHASLDEEEKTRRAALREEARLKICWTNLISEMAKNTCSLSDTIEEIGKLEADKRFKEICEPEIKRLETDMLNLLKISQAQINVSKHVENLQLTVLNKMLNDIKQASVDVNPETASPSLSHYDYQPKRNHTWQLCPGNLTRNDDSASLLVSSSEESSLNDSGDEAKQGLNITPISKTVDVRDLLYRSVYKPQVCPGNPACSTSYQQNLQKSPKKMRVEQDYENVKVSFHDPDNNTSTLTHEGGTDDAPITPNSYWIQRSREDSWHRIWRVGGVTATLRQETLL